MTFQFGQITAASPFALATAFNPPILTRPHDSAVVTIRKALGQLSAEVQGSTLEQIEVQKVARALIATAKRLLSPAMYRAFLLWGERATAFATLCTDDEASGKLCELHCEALQRVEAAPSVNGHDSAFKAYLLGLEMMDAGCFGPLLNDPEEQYTVDRMAMGLIRSSQLLIDVEALSALAWESDPERYAWSVEVGTAVAAEFAVERLALDEHGGSVEPDLESLIAALGHADREVRDVPVAEEGPFLDRQRAAERAMLAYPPRTITDVLRKIEVMSARGLGLADCAEEFLPRDLAQLAQTGVGVLPSAVGDAELLSAFAQVRRHVSVILDTQGGPASAAADEEIEKIENVVIDSRAQTVEGAVAKLRLAYQRICEDWGAQHALVDPSDPAFAGDDRLGDYRYRMFWETIEDLARIAGVDLSAPVEAVH